MKRGIVLSIVILMLAAAGMLIGQSSISGGSVTSSGAITSGHCASFASSTVIQDSGGTCGGGGSTPTGTGFIHVTSGTQDGASKLVDLTAATDVAANQGTTTTVLHGNAAGQGSFGKVALTADVSGSLPPANGGVASSSVASQDYFLAPAGIIGATSSANRGAQTSNKVQGCQFDLDRSVTFTRMSVWVVTTSNGNHENIGIYNGAGTSLLVQGTVTLGASSGVIGTATVSQTTLNPGTYWLETSPDNATSALIAFGTMSTGTSLLNGGSIVRNGASANSTSAGVMPASLGVVTANTTGCAQVLLEP